MLISLVWAGTISEENKAHAAFIIYDGIYKFQTLPFDLSGAPATFQLLIVKFLCGISWKYVSHRKSVNAKSSGKPRDAKR